MKCRQGGRAAIRRERPCCVQRVAEAGGNALGQGRLASDELPTLAAAITIEVVAIRAGEAVKGTAPADGPEAPA
jgi:hypothetical protein